MKIKTIRFNEKELEIVNDFAKENELNFSDAVKSLIMLNCKSDFKKSDFLKKREVESKPLTIRLFKDDYMRLHQIAESKGVSVPQEIRFRISSTMGTSLYDMNEAKNLLTVANDISKVGRLMNQAIKERLLMGTRITSELSDKIDELDSGLKKLFINTMHRIK